MWGREKDKEPECERLKNRTAETNRNETQEGAATCFAKEGDGVWRLKQHKHTQCERLMVNREKTEAALDADG